jgi:hypothetical protein
MEFRVHATQRMFKRNFLEADIVQCLEYGYIIEKYDDDLPFPSFLINGKTENSRPLHVVIGVDDNAKRLYIITVYEPDTLKWHDNFNRRIAT